MKNLVLSMLGVALFCTAANAWRESDMEIKISNLTKQQLANLSAMHLSGDVWPSENSAFATLYVVPSELSQLDRAGIAYTVTIPNMKEHYKDFWAKQASRVHAQAYHSYDQIMALMDSMVKTFPSICAKISLGASVQNRQLCLLKISKNVSQHENEAQICFDGGIHGDEIGGPENLIRFAVELCSQYGADTTTTKLIDSREIFIYCMVNPDGRDTMNRNNANNVDCNRNEGYMWASGGGPAPFSEPETKALRMAVLSNQFTLQISYHSGIEEILYPWCYTAMATPDKDHHTVLTNLYASTSGYGASLRTMQSYADYPTNGETIDFNYGTMGIAGLTLEISNDKQPTDISGYYAKNYPAMLKMIEYAGYGIEGTVVDSVDDKPIAAVLYCESSFPLYANPEVGDYHKFVKAGSYRLTATANGYISKTVSVIVQDGKSTVTPIRLQRDMQSKKSCGYKVVTIDNAGLSTFDVLGAPDNKPCVLTGSVGMIVDMQNPIADTAGKEITVRVSGTTSIYACFAGQSPDGPWKSLGTATKTDSFDLAQGALKSAQYIKIQSASCGLDAIEGNWEYHFQTAISKKGGGSAALNPKITVTRVHGKLDIRVKGASAFYLSIFDVRGRIAFASKITGNRCLWQPPAKGVYLVVASAEGLCADRWLVTVAELSAR